MKLGWISCLIILVFVAQRAEAFLFWKRQLDFSGEKEIYLSDNGLNYGKIKTEATTVGDLVERLGFELNNEDQTYPAIETELLPGMRVQVLRSVPVEILVDGGRIEKRVLAKEVDGALSEAGVELAPLDKINLGKDAPVVAGAKIEVTRIEVEEVSEEEAIEFEVREEENEKLRWRTEKVTQKGEKGLKKIDYKITYKNGKLESKKKVAEEVLRKPVPEIVSIGTKIEVGETQKGRASWYAHTGTMTCASVKFPRGTWLRVTAKGSGKQVFVQVNDYGPNPKTGKVIDLDKIAFKQLAPLGTGVINVKVEEILN